MCKLNKKNKGKRIDPCMRTNLSKYCIRAWGIDKKKVRIISSCCGHGKYEPTIIVVDKKSKITYDIVSGVKMLRKKKFYKRDKQGYYYIPEVVEKWK